MGGARLRTKSCGFGLFAPVREPLRRSRLLQTYSHRLEARCLECDAPICPLCILRVQERLLFPDCREGAK